MIGRPQSTPWSRWVGALAEALPGGHLALDAVVAYVDGELPAGPAGRAAAHVDRCPACAGEVMAQRQARRRLRRADAPGVPDSLLCSLRAIPSCAELPEAPAGLTLDGDGNFVVPSAPSAERAGRAARGAGARRLPVVVATGLVAGAAAVVGPVVAAGAVPAVAPPTATPAAGASLSARVPAPPVGERGNPADGSLSSAGPAGAVPATAEPTAPPTPGPPPASGPSPLTMPPA